MMAHIIPQSYLKGFTDPDTPEGHEPFLHLYDFAARSWENRSPKRALWQTDYYALPGKVGEEKDALDHGPMGVIEARALEIVRRKIIPKQRLTSDEKEDYAVFIGLMMGRVPAQRERMDRIVSYQTTQLLQLMARFHPGRYERMVEAYERETGQRAPSLAEGLTLVDTGKLTFRASQGDQLQAMAGVMEVAAVTLSRMQWVFYHTTPPHWFITSDNPVSLRVPDHPEWGFGLRRKDIQVSFPVTRTIGLIASWGVGDDIHMALPRTVELGSGGIVRIGDEPIKAINVQQIGFASQHIAAPSRQFPSAELLERKAEIPAMLHFLASGPDDEEVGKVNGPC